MNVVMLIHERLEMVVNVLDVSVSLVKPDLELVCPCCVGRRVKTFNTLTY
jgi:hypothetical protein